MKKLKPLKPMRPLKRPAGKARVAVSYANCEMYATFETTCPLCGVTVAPLTWHKCSSSQAT